MTEFLQHMINMLILGSTYALLGIGLTLVRTLVALHGGDVKARSEGAGCGSTFTVSLPVAHDEAPPVDPRRTEPQAVVSLRVLVVDDNQDARETIAEVLRMMGANVSSAPDGAEALAAAAGGDLPDLVLLDIGLPGMDGYETAREWRRRFGTHTKLVALTGYGSDEDRRRSLRSGFDAHLVKPVSVQAIEALLR